MAHSDGSDENDARAEDANVRENVEAVAVPETSSVRTCYTTSKVSVNNSRFYIIR